MFTGPGYELIMVRALKITRRNIELRLDIDIEHNFQRAQYLAHSLIGTS